MARREARLLVSIWDDPDFLALSPLAQRLFMFLLSQPDLTHDGVLAVRTRRWSKKAAGLTPAQITESLDELADTRFVIVDDDAEELVIRSFIRGDKVYRQPNVLHAAADHLATVHSPIIRAAIAAELQRIIEADDGIPDKARPILEAMLEGLPKGSANPSGNPSPNPSGNPSRGTPGERGVVTAVSRDSPYPDSPKSPNPVGAAARRPRAQARERGTRIPADFAVTDDMKTWFAAHCPGVDGPRETEKFRNYWSAKSGKDATKVDWPATWRNWMLTAADRAGPRPGSAYTGATRHTAQRHDNPFAEQS